jgi:ARG/rhodanese/phosphatase superfamily protein
VISERSEATVDTLVADNRGKTSVLLLAGEIVLGGKQNRVIADDVLLPPRSGPLGIPVYCVEQGRWGERGSKEFGAAGSFAAPALRARVAEPAAQGKVWAEVSRYAADARAQSPTGSYQAIYDRPEVSAHQREVAHAIDDPPAGALGAAVFVGERLTGLDLFQDQDLFRREWGKLLGAQALETYGRRDEPKLTGSKRRSRVDSLIRLAAAAEGRFRRSVGVGALFEFRVRELRGTALVAEARVIHTAIL